MVRALQKLGAGGEEVLGRLESQRARRVGDRRAARDGFDTHRIPVLHAHQGRAPGLIARARKWAGSVAAVQPDSLARRLPWLWLLRRNGGSAREPQSISV